MADEQLTVIHQGKLAGRRAEMALIRAVIEGAERGHGGVLAFSGSSGRGKSRLAWEAIREAQALGMLSAHLPGRGGVIRPFDPLADLTRTVLDLDTNRSADEQRAEVRQQAGFLQIDAEIAILFELLGLPAESESEVRTVIMGPLRDPAQTVILAEEVAYAEAVRSVVRRWLVASDRPLLAVFDDIDQASPATQYLFVALAKMAADHALAVLATSSQDIPPDVTAALGAPPDILDRLPRHETLAQAESLLRAEALSASLSDIVWERSNGDPLAIMVLARHLRGMDFFSVDEITGEAALQGVYSIPDTREMIVGRARRLPADQREALYAAAVLGSGLRSGALRALCKDIRPAQLTPALQALIDDGWLEATGSGRRTVYRFAHRLVERLLYDELPEEDRMHLHLRAGDYYAVPATGRRPRPAPALHHYQMAGHVERALTVVEMAIENASVADRERLLWLYRRGAEIAGADGQFAPDQARLAERLGDIHAAADDYAGAAAAYETFSPQERPLRLAGKLGLTLLAHEPKQAAILLGDLQARQAPDGDHTLYWRIVAGLGWALALTRNAYRAVRVVRDGLARLSDYPGLGDERTLLLGMLGMVMAATGDKEEARHHIESARAGWGARGSEEGVMLMNMVLIDASTEELTHRWLHFVLPPLLEASGD